MANEYIINGITIPSVVPAKMFTTGLYMCNIFNKITLVPLATKIWTRYIANDSFPRKIKKIKILFNTALSDNCIIINDPKVATVINKNWKPRVFLVIEKYKYSKRVNKKIFNSKSLLLFSNTKNCLLNLENIMPILKNIKYWKVWLKGLKL